MAFTSAFTWASLFRADYAQPLPPATQRVLARARSGVRHEVRQVIALLAVDPIARRVDEHVSRDAGGRVEGRFQDLFQTERAQAIEQACHSRYVLRSAGTSAARRPGSPGLVTAATTPTRTSTANRPIIARSPQPEMLVTEWESTPLEIQACHAAARPFPPP